MDSMKDPIQGLREYEQEVYRTMSSLDDPRFASIEPHEAEMLLAATGLCGETGEVADMVKKHVFHSHPLDREKMIKELGDVFWYLVQMTQAVGSNLEEVATKNSDKLRARYPNGFNPEDSAARRDVNGN